MGLDISVVANLSPLERQPTDDEEEEFYRKYVRIFRHDYFQEQADDLQTGFYEGEYITSFRAGSYSGYNQWREQLARMALGVEPDVIWANPEAYKGQAFFELINFADCEGTIGPKTSKKLYQDFLTFDEMAKQGYEPERKGVFIEQNWFYDKYKEWMEAFQIASTQNGAILFH